MSVNSGKQQDGCPVKHSKSIVGACSICKRTVCEDCNAPIKNAGKLLCKFCYDEMRGIDKTVQEVVKTQETLKKKGFFGRLLARLTGKDKDLSTKNVQTDCSINVHVKPVISTCAICKKTVCENCVAASKVGESIVCKKCHKEVFEVDKFMAEEKARSFWGGIRGFIAMLLYIFKVVLVIAFIICLIGGAIIGGLYMLHPEGDGFAFIAEDWAAKDYRRIVVEDIPIVLQEARDRFMCYFVYDKEYVSPYAVPEETMEVKLDAFGRPVIGKDGKPVMVPKKAPAETEKK